MNYRFGFVGGMVAIFATAGCGDSPNPATPTAPASALVSAELAPPGTATGEPTGFAAQSVAGEWNKPPRKPRRFVAIPHPGEIDLRWQPAHPMEAVKGWEIRIWRAGSGQPHDWRRMANGPKDCLSDFSGCFVHVDGKAGEYRIRNVTHGIKYRFRMHVTNDYGGTWSRRVTALAKGSTPGQPTIKFARAVSDTAIQFFWTNPKNDRITGFGFRYKRSELPEFPNNTIGTERYYSDGTDWIDRETPWNEAITFIGLEPNTRYTLQVRLLNDAGPGIPSTPINWRTHPEGCNYLGCE